MISKFAVSVPPELASASWTPDSAHLLTLLSQNTSLQFRDLQGNVQYTIDDSSIPNFSNSGITSVVWAPDGNTLAIGHESGVIDLWNNQTRQSKVISGHTDTVLSLAWSSDGKLLASASSDKTVKIWDAQGTLISTMVGQGVLPDMLQGGFVSQVSWSYDNKFLMSGAATIALTGRSKSNGSQDNGSVLLYHPDGTFVAQFEPDEIAWAVWQPKHDTVITMSFSTHILHFWNTKGELINTPEISAPWSLAWTSDGSLLAVSGLGVEIWSGNGQTQLKALIFPDIHSAIRSIAWSRDANYLAMGSISGEVKIWKVDLASPPRPL